MVSGGNAVSSELTDGELGGIIVGVIGFVVIIAVAFYCLYKSKMNVKVKTPTTMQVEKAEVAQDKL